MNRTAQLKKNDPECRGHFLNRRLLVVVVPTVVTPNDYRAVSIMVVPTTVPAAIIATVKPVVPVTIVPVVATDPETELLSTGEPRCCHAECRHSGENITSLPHCASPLLVTITNQWGMAPFREQPRNFIEQTFTSIAMWKYKFRPTKE
ncbi:flavoprotein [Bradyrhizobium sp. LB1.3]